MHKIIIFFLAGIIVCTPACNKRKSPHEIIRGKDVSVIYGRPYKKDREIFGKLVPYGEVWRCGADEATEITFDKIVSFAGKQVQEGTYTLFVIPKENEWTIILNSELEQFGAFDYEKYKDKDVLHAVVPVNHLDTAVEQHTIRFNDNNSMVIEWDHTQVVVPVAS